MTPFLFGVSDKLYHRVHPLLTRLGLKAPSTASGADEGSDAPRIVFLGFHRIAAALLHDLEVLHPSVLGRTLVIDINVSTHERIRKTGARVVYGDIGSTAVLEHARVQEAELVISTVPDELLKKTSNASLARTVRALNPTATIIAHATRLPDVDELLRAGADDVFVAPVETANAILPAIEAALNGELSAYLQARDPIHGHLAARHHALD